MFLTYIQCGYNVAKNETITMHALAYLHTFKLA